MVSKALDLVTMGYALDVLERSFLKGCSWSGATSDQQWFLEWWQQHQYQIAELGGLEALASTDANVLNDFLTAHGFEPKFDQFDPDGFGAASILDMLVEWALPAQLTTIWAHSPDHDLVKYPAFQIPKNGVLFHKVEGFTSPLVELLTKSGDSLWLMMLLGEPKDELGVATIADRLMRQSREVDTSWSGVVVPKVELQIEPDLSWMLGVSAQLPADYFVIVQAFQQFKLRMNEHGARAKVASGFGVTRGISLQPQPLQINRPFIGFFTQKGWNLPVAAFYADYDSWVEPAGSLEEL